MGEVTSDATSETRRRLPPVHCRNRNGDSFTCAGGDSCCGDVCVARGDTCCVNVNGNTFPCQGDGGGCCGNACFAPGSKCCRSLFKPRRQWVCRILTGGVGGYRSTGGVARSAVRGDRGGDVGCDLGDAAPVATCSLPQSQRR